MPTTEIAGLPLVAGSNIDDPQNKAAIRLKECVESVLQKHGVQSFYFGMKHCPKGELEAMITKFRAYWDRTREDRLTSPAYNSIEDHWAWKRHPEYQAVNGRVGTIFDGPGYMYHVDFEPFDDFHRAVRAPVTEISTFYFDGEPSSASWTR